MRKELIIGIGLLLSISSVQLTAQPRLSVQQVDIQTYQYWQNQDWNNLIRLSHEALDAGIDFYYLRVRLGIAYYAKGNFHAALPQFEKAWRQNQSEEYLKEYLYYTYRFTDRWAEANMLARTFSTELQQKTRTTKKPFANQFDLAYGYQGLMDNSVIDTYQTDADPLQNGYQYIPLRIQSVYAGLQIPIGNRFQLYQAFTGLSVDHFRYVQNEGLATTDNPYHTDIGQYYAAGNMLLGKGFNLSVGGHVINVFYPVTSVVFRQGRTYLLTQTYSDVDGVAFATLYKKLTYATLGAGFTYGTVNNARQYQTDLKLSLYPLGNKNLYATTVAMHQRQESVYDVWSDRWILDQSLGVKLTSRLWLEGYATLGEMENLAMNDAALIYNRMDVIRERYGARLIVLAGAHWQLQVHYGLLNASSSFIDSTAGVAQNTLTYRQQVINGILTWKF